MTVLPHDAPRRPLRADDDELAQLMTRVAQADPAAFAELYDRTSAHINGLVLRIVRAPDQSAEVFQEVYLQIWRQASRFDPNKGSVWAWITTLAHRRSIDRIRTAEASSAREQTFASRQHNAEIDDVWEDVSRRVDAMAVRDALLRLSPKQRQALTLAYFDGRTAADIADQLEVAVGTVKTRIRDGLIGLRAHLAANWPDGRTFTV